MSFTSGLHSLCGMVWCRTLTLNVAYHTIPHKLCRFEMKDMHGPQRFSSTDSYGSEFAFFILCLNQEIFLKHFTFQNQILPFSVQSWQGQILELKSFTTDTRRVRVKSRTLVATLPGAHHNRVHARTGRPRLVSVHPDRVCINCRDASLLALHVSWNCVFWSILQCTCWCKKMTLKTIHWKFVLEVPWNFKPKRNFLKAGNISCFSLAVLWKIVQLTTQPCTKLM